MHRRRDAVNPRAEGPPRRPAGLGIPGRYTSGYFYPEGAKGEVREQASHAWAKAWLEPRGWVGIDPTDDRLTGERYVRVACGRDHADVALIRGSSRGGDTARLDVEVSVRAMQQQ